MLWAGELGSGERKSDGGCQDPEEELAAPRFIQQADSHPILEEFSIPCACGASREDPWVDLGPRVTNAMCWAGISSQGLIPRAKSLREPQGLREIPHFFQNH